MAAGLVNTCAIDERDALWCWRSNDAGQVGDGTSEPRLQPTRVIDPGPWATVGLGHNHACAIRTDGALFCWGFGFHALGVGGVANRHEPARVGGRTDWATVAGGCCQPKVPPNFSTNLRCHPTSRPTYKVPPNFSTA